MAYTPINWQTGDTITADKLNKMDNGWAVESTQLFSETVTATEGGSGLYGAELAYSGTITADTIIVTYDGTDYECPSIDSGTYGAPWSDELEAYDFSEYPFNLYSEMNVFTGGVTNSLATQTAGEHTVSVSVTALQTSADFDKARGYGYKDAVLFNETVTAASASATVQLAYSGAIDANTITVTFDGTEYECANRVSAPYGTYGAAPRFPSGYNFSVFPFSIGSSNGVNRITVETAGEHTVSVTATSMQVSSDFSVAVGAAAVNSTVGPFLCESGKTTLDDMGTALESLRLLYFYDGNGVCCIITLMYTDNSGTHVTFIPDDTSYTAGFDENDVFTLTPAS